MSTPVAELLVLVVFDLYDDTEPLSPNSLHDDLFEGGGLFVKTQFAGGGLINGGAQPSL